MSDLLDDARSERRATTRWLDLFALETRSLTILYWAAVGLVVAGFFATRLLPCVDYPQHLGLSDLARRLVDANAPEQARYELDYFTYNGLFHLVVATLSTVVPIELAGRTVVAASLLATSAGVVALLRALGRPAWHAAFFTPILFSFSLGWGFVNYVLATAVALWALVFVVRAALRPSAANLAAIAALGLVCAFAHVLAMLILCVAAAVLAIELAWRESGKGAGADERGTVPRRLLATTMRAAVVLLPLVVGCAFCVAVYHRQYAWNPEVYRDPTLEGSAPPLWEKAFYFSAFATDLYGDASDQFFLWASIALMTGVTAMRINARSSGADAGTDLHARSRAQGQVSTAAPPTVALFLAMTLAYFATPMVLIGTHLIFPRLGQWLILGAVLAVPDPAGRWVGRVQYGAAALGLVAGANAFAHCVYFGWETRDASAMLDDLPPGRAATAVICDSWTDSFRNGTLVHLAAYYAARKHGTWAFSFARYLSVPVRFKPGATLPWPARGWEFSAEDYDARCKYARAFPLVIVKTPADLPTDASSEPQVRSLIFKGDANAVRLLSHHGAYWAFDTAGLPEDGTL